MEELHFQELEELMQELEEDSGVQDSPPPEVEELLQVLQSGGESIDRRNAAEELGNVETSSPQIVRALIAAYESDPASMVNRAAAKSLRAPLHQEYLQQHPELMEATDRALQQRAGSAGSMGGVVTTVSPADTYAKMQKEVRGWGLGLLAIGVLSLFVSGLSEPWGLVLLVAGLASFLFRETPMFVVYGIILSWAAISNILSGQFGWIAFAVFQLVLVFSVFRKHTRYRRAEAALDSQPGPQRASRAFPQIGCALGALALSGLTIIFVVAILFSLTGTTAWEGLLAWLNGLAIGLAVLGLAVAVAALLSGYRHKVMAVLGLVASSLVLLVELAFAIMSVVGGLTA